jgi:hypothetical protein
MHDLWPMHRIGPQPQALHYSFEKAGLTLHDQPVPWNAEAVLVEALLCLRTTAARRKGDFQLRIPGMEPVTPESLRRDEANEVHRLFFRIPPPRQSATATVVWRNHTLGQVTLPVLSRDEFIQNIRLQLPTLYVRLGNESVACQTYVSTQCHGLLASALITSPTSLVPLLDLGLSVEFRSGRSGQTHTVPARLCSSQLSGRQALVTVVPRRFPRRIGTWLATWVLGDRPLITHQVRAISQRHFLRSLRLSDTRFVVQSGKDKVTLSRHLPSGPGLKRVGPCFLVSSREPGMAGIAKLQVRAQVTGSIQPPLLQEQEVLITDGPTMVAPGTLDASEVTQVSAFELSSKLGPLGVLSLCPAPSASFTPEGGFKMPHDFTWTAAADEELGERLGRLLEGRGNSD